jgi:gliding motility-associated-like protein
MKKSLILLLILLSIKVFPQFSKTHYIPPLSSSNDVEPEDQYLYISTPSVTPVHFRIINLGGSTEEGTVSRDTPYISSLGFGADTQLNVAQSEVNTVLTNKGFIVEADDMIYVTARVIAGNSNQAGELVSKGLAALGTQFRIGGLLNTLLPNYGTVDYTFVSILATENDTHVSFSDIFAPIQLVNNPGAGNTPSDITLNSGESFVMAVQGPLEANRDGLIGSLVTSDKPIALNCGSFGGSNGEMSNLDLGFDQIVSAERTGTDYIFIKSTGLPNVEKVLIIAHENGTQIFKDGSTTPVAMLNAGQYMTFNGNDYSGSGNLYVHSSKNIFAYQSIGDDGRTDQANQELFFVPPLSCQTPKVIDNIPFLNLVGDRVFNGRVTIVTETGSSLDFIIDATPYTLSSLPSTITVDGPMSVTGNPDYVTYVITGLEGNVSVFSSGQLYLASYGSSQAATFGGFYSGFTFKPEVAFDRVDVAQSNCIPNVELSVSALTAFDVFQWFFNDLPIAGATLSHYTPTQPGYYHVSATISACGTTLISDKIPVSDCPDDMDNDMSNDNVDLDNDNDGITNCMESAGSLPFDLSNPLAGNVSTGQFPFTGSFPPSNGTPATVPFTGFADGNFISETNAGKGYSTIYKMDFPLSASISLEYPATAAPSDLINAAEEFVISVPVDKTISVLNPDNQLLIDTNYDGIYESGVTEFSSFEIRFRLNGSTPLPAGTGTFSFRSYLAGTFTYTHINLVDNAPSRATFRIFTTCIPKDSDLDGTPDQLDLDSENDGIPDAYESQGAAYQPLSHVDDNHDGLDDIFGTGVMADTDNDNVPDYLDLDSDNDGVYDLVEAASGANDANNNGIIDGSATSFGNNGLANSIETPVDSDSLNFAVADSDADGTFNYTESDADNDQCSDVLEAGFADANNDGYLGNSAPPTVDANGVVTGAGSGYTTPNPNYANPMPIIIDAQPQDFLSCELQDATITIQTNAGVGYQWQISSDGVTFTSLSDNTIYTGTTTSTLTIHSVTAEMDGQQFKVLLDRPGNICGAVSATAVLHINALPPVVTKSLVQCDTGMSPDGITLFNLAEANSSLTGGNPNLSLAFYLNMADAQGNINALDNDYTNVSNPQTLTVKITDTTSGCSSYSTLTLSVNLLANQIINLPEQCETFGQEDGFLLFDLSQANIPVSPTQTIRYYENETDALLEQNAIANPQQYQNLQPYVAQTVYARTESGNNCSRLYLINIKVNPLPDIDVNPDLEPHVVCVNTATFNTTIDAAIQDGSSPNDYTYQWFFEGNLMTGIDDYQITVSTEGVYTVIVTDANGCDKTRTIPVVASSMAIIDGIVILDLSDFNTVTVTLTSNSYGDYVYSLDYQNAFQSSGTFTNVMAGIHTVFVKDLNGCPTVSHVISVLGIPPYFTPNGDGFNDTWNVKGISSQFHPNTTTTIFDRYGKLIKQIGASGTGWDGTYNGSPLPADDYWFVVKFDDGETAKGHFALKR